MAIRDRGILKWAPASFMPLGFEMTRKMFKDQERQARPLLDEYQVEEFYQRIAYAMESRCAVKLSVWADGFTTEITGRINCVDPITKQLRIELRDREFERVSFEDVVGVLVVD